MSVKPTPRAKKRTLLSRERLRRRYRPRRVRVLFLGEAPPASGRFFYQADSGLYRAIRDAFVEAFPTLATCDFLESFRGLGCYLVDLCDRPVDRSNSRLRREVCRNGEARLCKTLRQLQPEIVVTVVSSIANNVRRSQKQANWYGLHIVLPYPGRWHRHRAEFLRKLVPALRKAFA